MQKENPQYLSRKRNGHENLAGRGDNGRSSWSVQKTPMPPTTKLPHLNQHDGARQGAKRLEPLI
jgi:hypothetical protein